MQMPNVSELFLHAVAGREAGWYISDSLGKDSRIRANVKTFACRFKRLQAATSSFEQFQAAPSG
eukprot:229424-Alexandrium_andersonii.AAC.1